YHGGEYSIRARHTLRNGSILPGNYMGWEEPQKESYYLHHPVLTHQWVTLTFLVLGEHESSVRAAALLSCLPSLVWLLLLVYRYFGPWQAALAGWVYVLVPINVWFAPHMHQGYPGMAGALAFLYFYLRWAEEERFSFAALSLLCLMLGAGFDWDPY